MKLHRIAQGFGLQAELLPGSVRLDGLLEAAGTVIATLARPGLRNLSLGFEVQHSIVGATILVELPAPSSHEGIGSIKVECESCLNGSGAAFSGELARGQILGLQRAAVLTVLARHATLMRPVNRRSLLQEGCSLAVGNGAPSFFSGCATVAAVAVPYKVFFTLKQPQRHHRVAGRAEG